MSGNHYLDSLSFQPILHTVYRYIVFIAGIVSGACTAGVVGYRIPVFDIAGATVMAATKISQSGMVNMVCLDIYILKTDVLNMSSLVPQRHHAVHGNMQCMATCSAWQHAVHGNMQFKQWIANRHHNDVCFSVYTWFKGRRFLDSRDPFCQL